MRDPELVRRIGDEVERIPLVDTHEHIMTEEERLAQEIDLFYFLPVYASSDLVSAGMFPEVLEEIRGQKMPAEEKWEQFAPWWRYARSTGYGRALEIAARDLFQVEEIAAHTWQELSSRIAKSNRKGWTAHVLKERAGIEVAIQDVHTTDLPTKRSGHTKPLIRSGASLSNIALRGALTMPL